MGPWAYELVQNILGDSGLSVVDCLSVCTAVMIVLVLGAAMGFFRRR